MQIRSYLGAQAHTAFRLEPLVKRLSARFQTLKAVNAQFIHLAAIDSSSGEFNESTLLNLLGSGDDSQALEQGVKIWVMPRLGTKSPWSTKATDIAHHCGLTAITRLERGVLWQLEFSDDLNFSESDRQVLAELLSDRMTESVLFDARQLDEVFQQTSPGQLGVIKVLSEGKQALEQANVTLGLALADDEIEYLYQSALMAKRDLTDVELMMFSQVNSEHCRHKIFNASWTIDGEDQQISLFGMIRNTHRQQPAGTLVAYKDNAAVIEGADSSRFFADSSGHEYGYHPEPVHILAKVETHNHPTAISPFPGAATGSGGEIRDEGATGRGGKPKAGVTGFSVSHLRIPALPQPWEMAENKPAHIATPLEIMLQGPIGGASFNNEFGRPNIAGYFRSFEHQLADTTRLGYHKPIMIAGGLGNVRPEHVEKEKIEAKAKIIVLGGPAMLIGLGGGAASSVASGQSDQALDFASVQRGNPEMQRRCQEVIDTCCAMGAENPIVSIHDVGAGGLSNALPELVHDADLGGDFELRQVHSDDPGMSPMEIWCNEAQERYVLAIDAEKLELFSQICQRERCLFSVVGEADQAQHLRLTDDWQQDDSNHPIDIDMGVLFGNPPKMHRTVDRSEFPQQSLDLSEVQIEEAVTRLLNFPAIADKTFLVTIADRSVTGMISRDQMVGPWQVPVADVAVTTSSYQGYSGEAMAMGEKAPLAAINPAASGRMAIAELITNIAAAPISQIKQIKLSANWMAATGFTGQDAALYDTVKAVGMELCPALDLAIPVGKDSMSMRTVWQDEADQQTVAAPVSLIVTGFSPVTDVRKVLTPELSLDEPQELLLIDLGEGKNRLGGSSLQQVYGALAAETADVNRPELLSNFFALIQQLNAEDLILAYHDRSDGGLFVSLVEMAFASRCGLDIKLDQLDDDHKSVLFNEEAGAVMQIRSCDKTQVLEHLERHGLSHCAHFIGSASDDGVIKISDNQQAIYQAKRVDLHRQWSQTSFHMQKLRDNPDCAQQEYDRLLDESDRGLYSQLTYDVKEDVCAPYLNMSKPKVAILREQGVNSQTEMAAAFDRAGFTSVDVHMSDLLEQRQSLSGFSGMVACGGFSFGDVLGAGLGWANSILYNAFLQDQFSEFFIRSDSFSLGVCNGCQMMSGLKQLIPGAAHWPRFITNQSQQYEARQVMVKIESNPSLFFAQMAGSEMPVVVAHGEGRAVFNSDEDHRAVEANNLVAARFIDHQANPTQAYPYNPNGSKAAITALTSQDGRATILMPHPERVFRSVTNSWRSSDWGEDSPWMRIFRNARCWVD